MRDISSLLKDRRRPDFPAIVVPESLMPLKLNSYFMVAWVPNPMSFMILVKQLEALHDQYREERRKPTIIKLNDGVLMRFPYFPGNTRKPILSPRGLQALLEQHLKFKFLTYRLVPSVIEKVFSERNPGIYKEDLSSPKPTGA